MKITTLQNAEKVPFNLDGRKMYSSEKVELVHLSLKQGEEIAPHSNPFDVVFFAIEGIGEVVVDDEIARLAANDSIFIGMNRQRGLKNTSKEILRVLVIKIF